MGLLEASILCSPRKSEKNAQGVFDLDLVRLALDTRDPGLRNISYLHRTVRDYFQLAYVWGRLLLQTKDTVFDPYVALFISYVIEMKTTNVIFRAETFHYGALEFLSRVVPFKPSTAESHTHLFEELDRAINMRCTRAGLEAIDGH